MKNKKGFTLSETLVTLTVIGVVAAITLPIINVTKPNKEKVMLKKAYITTARIVSELMEDEKIYPHFIDNGGFSVDGGSMFCTNFSAKLNTVGNASGCSFYTTDGINWNLESIDWSGTENDGVLVDVNGAALPNCLDGTDGCNRPDRFLIRIAPDGHIKVIGSKAKEYLESISIHK